MQGEGGRAFDLHCAACVLDTAAQGGQAAALPYSFFGRRTVVCDGQSPVFCVLTNSIHFAAARVAHTVGGTLPNCQCHQAAQGGIRRKIPGQAHPRTQRGGAFLRIYPVNDSIRLLWYPYENDEGQSCSVSFFMRLDGTEWDEANDELPPRYAEYKAALGQ